MTARMRVIETGSLTLEPQIMAHAEEMFVVLSDPAIYAHENQPPRSLEWLRTRFAKLETRLSADGREQWLNWVIRLPTSELIGYVQATIYPDGRAAIAYELSSAYWGRGLGSQAVKAMISELVEHYGVRRLSAVLVRGNLRSKHLLERLDFSLASPEQHAAHRVARGEMLMRRKITIGDAMKQTGDDVIMKIAPPATADDANWLSMRDRLWPDGTESEHLADMADALRRGHRVRLALAADDTAIGFVEASKRVDYVNGTSSSPVVFLEGLYVEPAARRKGVARALVADVENWARAERCSELASDSPLENVQAHAAHRALGFEEMERVVYFRRPVPGLKVAR